jgi:hypothetical protein
VIYYFAQKIRKELTTSIKNCSFLDFIENNTNYKISTMKNTDNSLNNYNSNLLLVPPTTEDYDCCLQNAADKLIKEIIDDISNGKYNEFFKIDYDIHFITAKSDDGPIMILKPDIEKEYGQYFYEFFNTKTPFTLVCDHKKILIEKIYKLTSKFNLNEKEIAKFKDYLLITKNKSILFVYYLVFKASQIDTLMNFFYPDGRQLSIEVWKNWVRVKLISEIYKVIY